MTAVFKSLLEEIDRENSTKKLILKFHRFYTGKLKSAATDGYIYKSNKKIENKSLLKMMLPIGSFYIIIFSDSDKQNTLLIVNYCCQL